MLAELELRTSSLLAVEKIKPKTEHASRQGDDSLDLTGRRGWTLDLKAARQSLQYEAITISTDVVYRGGPDVIN